MLHLESIGSHRVRIIRAQACGRCSVDLHCDSLRETSRGRSTVEQLRNTVSAPANVSSQSSWWVSSPTQAPSSLSTVTEACSRTRCRDEQPDLNGEKAYTRSLTNPLMPVTGDTRMAEESADEPARAKREMSPIAPSAAEIEQHEMRSPQDTTSR